MRGLFRNIRFYVLAVSIALSWAIYQYVSALLPAPDSIHRLVQVYALLSVAYLYFALLATPLYYSFPKFPGRGSYVKARRAIGVSAFYFGFLHAQLAFSGLLGGFAGLAFFQGRYLWALAAGALALLILFALTLTSTDWAVKKLGYRTWKAIHRLVYAAGVLILFHAFTMGSHFADLSSTIPTILYVALGILLILEVLRAWGWWRTRFSKPSLGVE